jgi:hypothetical protein
MIVLKSRYIRTHVVDGGGIFDTIANIVKQITGNTVGDLASKLLVSAGKSMASEAGKRLASRFVTPPSSAPQSVTIYQPPPSSTPAVIAPLPLSAPQNAVNYQTS